MAAALENPVGLFRNATTAAERSSVAVLPPEIPGPRPMFLLGWRGNLLRCAPDPVGYLAALHKTYGEVAVVERGGRLKLLSRADDCPGNVAVFGPRYNREVLGNPDVFHMSLTTGLEGTPLERLGAGMFSTNGDKLKQVRREMAPAFHKKLIDAYHHDLVAQTSRMLDGWRPGCRRDVLEDMDRLIFRVSCRALFGWGEAHEVDALGSLVRRWIKMAYSPAVRQLSVDLPFSPYRRFFKVSASLDQALVSLLRRNAGPGDEKNLLGMLNAGFLSEGECVGQALSLLIAAHDTTAGALAWTLFLLSQHPQIMGELWAELVGQFRGDAPDLEQLGRLPLLDYVVKESLRLLPPVPFAGRVTAEPATLGAYRLPRETQVLYSQYVTHRLPEIYSQPEKFLPGRWARINPSPYEYLPFGAGPRRCLGANLAVSQIKTVLAMVLQRYRLQLVPRARVDRLLRLTLLPRGGMPMIVWNQDRRFGDNKTKVQGNVREMVDLS